MSICVLYYVPEFTLVTCSSYKSDNSALTTINFVYYSIMDPMNECVTV